MLNPFMTCQIYLGQKIAIFLFVTIALVYTNMKIEKLITKHFFK